MQKKILILYTSIGLGHKYIALNMAHHLEQAGYAVLLHDVLQLQEGKLVELGEWLHSVVNRKFPWVWRWAYMSELFSKVTLPLRVPLARRNNNQVKKVIDGFQPDVVLSTQTSASATVASLKRDNLFHGKFVIAFSDYHLHKYWLYDEADAYIANIDEQKQEMIRLGIASEKIVVAGITLQKPQPTDPQAARSKLGIGDSPVVLIGSGSLGIGFPESLLKSYAEQMLHVSPNTKIIIACGKNENLKNQLQSYGLANVLALGFYEPMSEIYAISDVFLTKPGGLTIAEALQQGIRVQITHWLPGQEELNYEYLTTHDLVEPVVDSLTAAILTQKTIDLLHRPKVELNKYADQITQKNHEGEVLLQAINSLFHGV